MPKVIFAPLLASVLLCGCAIGPNYQTPTPVASPPANFSAATPLTVAPAGDVQDDWWRLYRNPELDALILKALAANTDLRVASANLARAKGALTEARSALYLPATQLTASATEGRTATGNGLAEIEGKKPRTSGADTFGFVASYEVDLFGRLRRASEAAHADTDAARAALDYARIVVASDTARAYVDACAYGEVLQAAQKSLEAARQTADITRERRRLGAAYELDVARAEALARQAAAAVPAAEAQRQAALFSLAVLTGQPPEAHIPGAEACIRPPALNAPTPVGDGVSLIRRRPDVKQAERQLAAETARIGVATAQLFPIVTLGGQIGGAGSTPDKAFNVYGSTFSVGPAVSWTVPNIVVARARIAEQKATTRAALARLDGAVLAALKDVEVALTNLDSERRRNVEFMSARDQLLRAADLAQTRYDRGAASFLDLLDAQRSLQAAQADVATSDLRRSEAEIALFRALGGGWLSAPAVVDPAR